jgi:hypothetical protein
MIGILAGSEFLAHLRINNLHVDLLLIIEELILQRTVIRNYLAKVI